MLFIAKDGYTFVRVLDEVGPCHATDPRDKVFGLLGHNSALIRAEKKPIIPADYGRTKLEIYPYAYLRLYPIWSSCLPCKFRKFMSRPRRDSSVMGPDMGSSRALSIHAVARRRSV